MSFSLENHWYDFAHIKYVKVLLWNCQGLSYSISIYEHRSNSQKLWSGCLPTGKILPWAVQQKLFLYFWNLQSVDMFWSKRCQILIRFDQVIHVSSKKLQNCSGHTLVVPKQLLIAPQWLDILKPVLESWVMYLSIGNILFQYL